MSVVMPVSTDHNDQVKENDSGGAIVSATATKSPASSNDSSNRVLVHEWVSCFGEACAHRWRQPIIGVRYKCLSCKKLKRRHNLCASCYAEYPYKSRELVDSLGDDADESKTSKHEGNADIFAVAPADSQLRDHEARGQSTVEHSFRCISSPGKSKNAPEKLYDPLAVDSKFKTRPIGDIVRKSAEFSHLEFWLLGILLYPFTVMNMLLHRLLTKRIRVAATNDEQEYRNANGSSSFAAGPLRWYLKQSLKWASYSTNLPLMYVGICLLVNGGAIVGIYAYQSVNGNCATVYWIYVYELFFFQSLTAETERFMVATSKRNIFEFLLRSCSGFSLLEHATAYSVGLSEIYSLIHCRRGELQSKPDSYRFIFPAPGGIDTLADIGNGATFSSLDPAKTLLMNASETKGDSIKMVFAAVLALSFAILIAIISVFSIDTSGMVLMLGEHIRLPDMVTYEVSHRQSIISGCHDEEFPVARLLLGLQLTPTPTTARGLPQLSLQFTNSNSSLYRPLKPSVEMFWYADLVATSPDLITLQLQDNHDFVPLIVSLANTNCSSVPYVTIYSDQVYPDSLNGLYLLRQPRSSHWEFLFYVMIVVPSILCCSCFRGIYMCQVVAMTWEMWQMFDSLTDPDESGGIWSPDHMGRLQIDFAVAQNCRAWYELRNHLCEITSINLRSGIAMLHIALVQFVAALAAVTWYTVSGEAPMPGFAYLICLCVNPLVVLMFLVPLTLIWCIQSSHIGLITDKFREVEMLPATTDPVQTEERRNAGRALFAIKTKLDSNDERVAVLGFELSPGFLWTLTTFAATAVSFFAGSSIQYTAPPS